MAGGDIDGDGTDELIVSGDKGSNGTVVILSDSDGDGEPDDCDDTPTGQTSPDLTDCCGGSVPMMMPFMLMGWSWMRRHRGGRSR